MVMDLSTENYLANESLQADEIEALSSIYGEEWVLEDACEKVYSKNITSSSGNSVYFQVIFPKSYPLQSPPVYRISAPWMSRQAKEYLSSVLEEIYSENAGQNIIYQWIIKVQDFIDGPDVNQTVTDFTVDLSDKLSETHLSTEVLDNIQLNGSDVTSSVEWDRDELPTIQHGECIIDRKSAFQAHIAKVVSVEQVGQVLKKLKENKKIASATHNMFAYRISLENKAFIQDCEDDGESKSGSVLLHLLQVLDARDVLVVVSRWYGGIHLGSDRFKHISNAARSVLTVSGYITKDHQSFRRKRW